MCIMEDTKKTHLNKVLDDMANKPYPRNRSKIQDVSNDFNAETVYIGAKRSKNVKIGLRIYDKKKEQGG